MLELKGVEGQRPHLALIDFFGTEFDDDSQVGDLIANAKNKQIIVNQDEVRKHYQSLKTDQ